GETSFELDQISVPATPETVATIDAHIASKALSKARDTDQSDEPERPPSGPIVLDGKRNLDQVEWVSKFAPRETVTPVQVPNSIRTPLKQ
ncbi:hypothetical protein NL529_28840, partial [Klebsiella pneumoniae]|nr:hypothetical protein [Klebsiella pneumoniae]